MIFDPWFHLHMQAQKSFLFWGIIAMAADSEAGPRNLVQCWHDCGQILAPFACRGDTIRRYVVWRRNWNRSRFDFVGTINRVYDQRKG